MSTKLAWGLPVHYDEICGIRKFQVDNMKPGALRKMLRQPGHCCRIVIDDSAGDEEIVLAYAAYVLHRDHIEIESVAAHPDSAGQGYREMLIDNLKSKLSGRQFRRLSILVDERMTHFLMYLKSQGFTPTKYKPVARRAFGEYDGVKMEFLPDLNGGNE